MKQMPHSFGRRGFGDSPATYAAVRPAYPAALYGCLTDRCGLKPGCAVIEIGPGSGIATASLLAHRPALLHAIEPDPRFVAHLRQTLPDPALTIEAAAFENAGLPPAHFDLGVAATSFHWIDQQSGLGKIHAALKPGGWWAMWWTHLGVETDDPFQAATRHLFAPVRPPAARSSNRRQPFDLDRAARLRDLTKAGFIDGRADAWQWTHCYDTAGLVGLYQTFSAIRALPVHERGRFLDEVGRIADDQFGGRIDRRFTTSLYTAQRAMR